jgi:DNA helicase-2/ATP-dependent DNA helicase PcrA
MTPSKYQNEIFSFLGTCHAGKHLRVDALAGSGKTSTCKWSLDYIPEGDATVMVAFNKAIADSLKKVVPFWVEAMTLHSFGFRILSEYKRMKVDKFKSGMILEQECYDLSNAKDRGRYYKERNTISRLVGLLKAEGYYKGVGIKDCQDLLGKYGLETPGDETRICENAIKVLMVGRECPTIIDFDDMIYMPLYLELEVPRFRWMYVDEFQDMNASQLDLIEKAGKSGTIVAVGDRHQSIYHFRGAKSDVMDEFVTRLGAHTLPLNVCYRCDVAIIKEAQKIVPEIEWADGAKEGKVATIKKDRFLKDVTDGDYVLCRTTEPLVQHCLKFIEQGRKAFVKGRDIGANLITLVEKIADRGSDFLYELDGYRMEESEKLSKFRDAEERIQGLEDRLDAIKAIHMACGTVCEVCGRSRADHREQEEIFDRMPGGAQGAKGHDFEASVNPKQIIRKIESIFSDDDRPGIQFMTVHRAKGQETDRVWILRPDLLPMKLPKMTDEQKQQERNLHYVAITRAKHELYYVGNE